MSVRKELRLVCGWAKYKGTYVFFAICDIRGGYAVQADVEHTFLSPFSFFFFLETNEKSADKLEIWANFIVVEHDQIFDYLNVLKIEKVDLQ